MTDMDLSEVISHGVVVRPGDKLLIAVPMNIHLDQLRRIRDEVAEYLPGVTAVVVPANQLAVYRPDTSEELTHGADVGHRYPQRDV